MAAPTTAQIKLIRDYEPALYFWGNPGDPDVERFYPSNAKRYLEQAALRLATTTSSYDWTTPVIQATRVSATDGEGGFGAVYLGERNSSGAPLYLEASGKQLFLEVSGWKPGDQHADLDSLARRYAPGGDLNDSQFWYHAEFFDAGRLRQLFGDAVDPGGSINDFGGLLEPQGGQPPVLTDPALVCYYLFYPGHEESLNGCRYGETGELIPTARDFGSFPGEWSCIAVLLDRAAATAPYVPKYVGLSNRNVGVINIAGEEIRTSMRLLPWSAMRTFEGSHPRLTVAKGSHALYVEGETIPPLLSDDPSASFCGGATPLNEPVPPGNPALPLVFLGKVVAGTAAGAALGGLLGSFIGAGAGLAWGIAEFEAAGPLFGTFIDFGVEPTVDAVSPTGFVIHPAGKRPADAAGQTAEWKSADGVEVGGRVYDFTVDRAAQVLWGKDPEGPGYTGRWGALVRDDPQTRRAGMTFPKFWHLFFDALVRNDPPSRTIVLKRDAGSTWPVPADWNNAENSIVCIGGGGAGAGGKVGAGGGGGGGGGGYSAVSNLTLSGTVTIAVGAGGTGDAGGSAASGGDTWFDGTSLATASVGAKGGTGAVALTGGTGGEQPGNNGGVGATRYLGGNGGTSGSFTAGSGGGGAAGPRGGGGNGGKGSKSVTGVTQGGGGGGGAGGGASGSVGQNGADNSDSIGGAGGNNAAGAGSGAPGTAGTVGGGGGGANGMTWSVGGAGGPGADYSGGGAGGAGGPASGTPSAGSTGGNYGGGGSGGGTTSASAAVGGDGAPGVIVITYTPA